jgi:flagellar biosynthesis/type III secretory pathway M-ring protein FliF/YscJ
VPEQAVRELVAASVTGLRPEAVAIVQAERPHMPAPQPGVVAVGPISVARESAGTLRAMLAAALLLHVLLAAGLIVVVARSRARWRAAKAPQPR